MSKIDKLDKDRWQTLSALLDQALDLNDAERALWLGALRIRDPEMAAELSRFLDVRDAIEQKCFLTLSPSMAAAPLVGQAVGAWVLESSIGQGGMGSVWLASRADDRFKGKAAVKLLNMSLIGHDGERRFRREGTILASLAHPHIARLLDAGIAETGQPYLILEYVDGQHIDAYCDAKNLDIDARVRLFLDVLSAVAHAHTNLIVHRDLKPSNVLVANDGVVKLLDFGIAKLIIDDAAPHVTGATAITREGGNALTPEYAAPEQLLGQPITTATDVYSLGVLLYLLLGGQHPNGNTNLPPAELVKAIVETAPPFVSDSVSQTKTVPQDTLSKNAAHRSATADKLKRLLRGDLDNIIAKALKKSPTERYTSVNAFADDLRKYLEHEPVTARPDSFGYRASKFVQRHRGGVAVGLLTIVAVSAGVIGTFWQAQRANEQARIAQQAAVVATNEATQRKLEADRANREASRADTEAQLARTERSRADEGATQARLERDRADAQSVAAKSSATRAIVSANDAIKATERAEQVKKFIASIFTSAVPRTGVGGEVLARDILSAASKRVETELNDNPRAAAELAMIIGNSFVELGEPEKAEDMLRKNLPLATQQFGAQHQITLQIKNTLAYTIRIRDPKQSEALLDAVLVDGLSSLPDGASILTRVYRQKSFLAGRRGAEQEAYSNMEKAIAISEKYLGADSDDLLISLGALSNTYKRFGKRKEALDSASELLKRATTTLGTKRPNIRLIEVERSYADALTMNLRSLEAVPILRRVLEDQQNLDATETTRVRNARSSLGGTLADSGQIIEGITVLRQAVSHELKSNTVASIDRVLLGSQLLRGLIAAKFLDEAMTEEDRIQAVRQRLGNQSERDELIINTRRARLLGLRGEYENAANTLAELRKSSANQPPVEKIGPWLDTAELLRLNKKFSEAKIYLDSADVIAKSISPHPSHSAALATEWGRYFVATNQFDAAQVHLSNCNKFFSETQIAGSPHASDCNIGVAQMLLSAKEAGSAESLLKPLVKAWNETNPNSAWHGESLYWLARAQAQLGQALEAEENMARARVMLRKSNLPLFLALANNV